MGKVKIHENNENVILDHEGLLRLGVPPDALTAAANAVAASVRKVSKTVMIDNAEQPGIYRGCEANMVQAWNTRRFLTEVGFVRAKLGKKVAWNFGECEVLFKLQRNQRKVFAPTSNPVPHLNGAFLIAYRFSTAGGPEKAGLTKLWIAKVKRVARAMTEDKKNKAGSNNSDMVVEWVYGAPIPRAAMAATVSA